MKSHEFKSNFATKLDTPSGGSVHFGLGEVFPEEGSEPIAAAAFSITDKNGTIIAEFALQSDTFGVLLEAIKMTYDDAFGAPEA